MNQHDYFEGRELKFNQNMVCIGFLKSGSYFILGLNILFCIVCSHEIISVVCVITTNQAELEAWTC